MQSKQCNHTCQTLDWKGSLRRGLLPRGNLRTWRGFWCKNIRGQSFSQNGKIILVQVFVTSESYGFFTFCLPLPEPWSHCFVVSPSPESYSGSCSISISISIVNIQHQHQHCQHRSSASTLIISISISTSIVNRYHQHHYCQHRSSASASKSQTCQYMLVTLLGGAGTGDRDSQWKGCGTQSLLSLYFAPESIRLELFWEKKNWRFGDFPAGLHPPPPPKPEKQLV